MDIYFDILIGKIFAEIGGKMRIFFIGNGAINGPRDTINVFSQRSVRLDTKRSRVLSVVDIIAETWEKDAYNGAYCIQCCFFFFFFFFFCCCFFMFLFLVFLFFLFFVFFLRFSLHQCRLKSKKISNVQEPIQSDPTSCPQNQKGNN